MTQTDASVAPHFHIFVNTRKKTVNGSSHASFAQIVALAELPTGENFVFTVTYYAPTGNAQGSLTAGESVRLAEGMVFNVTATDKS